MLYVSAVFLLQLVYTCIRLCCNILFLKCALTLCVCVCVCRVVHVADSAWQRSINAQRRDAICVLNPTMKVRN
jgi:hypothetical protein